MPNLSHLPQMRLAVQSDSYSDIKDNSIKNGLNQQTGKQLQSNAEATFALRISVAIQ